MLEKYVDSLRLKIAYYEALRTEMQKQGLPRLATYDAIIDFCKLELAYAERSTESTM